MRRHVSVGAPMASDDGGIGLLGIGLSVCVSMLLVGGVAVSSAQMARVDVRDAADHASAAAADRISVSHVYEAGVDSMVLDESEARAEATRVLAQTPRPPHVASWRVTSVRVNAERVDVRVSAVVHPPVIGSAMAALAVPVTVDVDSHADAHLQR